MKLKHSSVIATILTVILFTIAPTQAATIGADGGITLYISYDNLDLAGGTSWNDSITQINIAVGASCGPTNIARTAQGAPASPGSCPIGDTCLGREKLQGDINLMAEYIYRATEGKHYLRRVYLSDNGRAWSQSDIRWNVGNGGSSAPHGWNVPFSSLSLNSGMRKCIHDVAHHEFGHYMYNLPDLYARGDGYYQGNVGAGNFSVSVDVGDPNSVMSANFPHVYVDTTNAQLTLTYNPGSGLVSGQVVTPALLVDGDPANDGPNRAHHGFTHPFAQDEWSRLPLEHIDLTGIHAEGIFNEPDFSAMPAVDFKFLGEEAPYPGTVLLLDRSGSMGVTTNGITAAQYVQEAGMYLYHSALPGDFIGTKLYNGTVEELFNYAVYDSTNQLPFASFRSASGSTNIAAALNSGIAALVAEHGEAGVNGAQLVLMSDGKQTTGPDLWTEVTHAADLGIKITTLSFGDADIPTMQSIATTTGGEVIELSEINDGSELKLAMNRELSELRGLRPIHLYKNTIVANGENQTGSFFEGTFLVPDLSRALQFYSFLEVGNAADFALQLEDEAGNIFNASPQNIAQKGRLNGVTVEKPSAGKWKYRISGSKRLKGTFPKTDAFELIAYTQNLSLDPSLSLVNAGPKYPGQLLIHGSLFHRYPLMNVKAVATIFSGNTKIASINLQDDGKQYIDATAKDGIYSALFDPRKYGLNDKQPKIRVDLALTTSKNSVPAEATHYEVDSDYKSIVAHYLSVTKMPFTAYATDIFSLRDTSKYNPRLTLVEPRTPASVKIGSTGQIKVVVENAYFDEKSLRASLGQGIKIERLGTERDTKLFRTSVYISYSVQKNAAEGERTLSLQANTQIVSSSPVLKILAARE
jgi:von Willebrand factor type A domain